MNLNNSSMRLFPLAGAEVRSDPRAGNYQPIGPSEVVSGLCDNWTIFPGRFSNSGSTEILCFDRSRGEAQVFSWSPGGLQPMGPVSSGWRKTAQVTVVSLAPGQPSQIMRTDSRFPDLETLRWDSGSGFVRTGFWPQGRSYLDRNGQRQAALLDRLFPGNFINSGETEFFAINAYSAILLRLDPKEGFVQIGPDMPRMVFQQGGDVIAGHFSNTRTMQIFYLVTNRMEITELGSYGKDPTVEITFYEIDPARGMVQLGQTVRDLALLKVPWKIYPTHPPAGEPALLICRGAGIAFLRYDPATTIRQILPKGDASMWPYNELMQICYGNFTGQGPALLYYDPATVNPTENKLDDFDICLARSRDVINQQIVRNWRQWMKEKVRIFYGYDKEGKFTQTKSGMEAWIAPLRIELNEPNARMGQIRVNVNLIEGIVKYQDEANGEWADYKFDRWEFSFLMNLDLVPVDRKFLSLMDPSAEKSVAQTIQKSGLPDSAFSIECLMLKSTDTKGRGEGNVTMKAPANAPGEAQDVMRRCVNLWRQGEVGRFLLGTVTRRVPQGPPPTFAVTSLAFGVHPDFEKPDGSTLAWLGTMEGRPMPNLDQARSKLADSWLRPPGDRPEILPGAMMAISRTMFMDRYLIAKFSSVLGAQPAFQMRGYCPEWTFIAKQVYETTSDDIIHRVFRDDSTSTLRLTINPRKDSKALAVEKCTIDMEVEVVSQVDMDGYLHLTNAHTEWIHTRGRLKMKGYVRLETDYSKGYFALKPTVRYGFDTVPVVATVEQDDIVGGAQVLVAFESVFKHLGLQGSTTAERLGNRQNFLITQMMEQTKDALQRLNLEFSQHAFIPNGGGVLSFCNPQFSRYGDLLFDVIDK